MLKYKLVVEYPQRAKGVAERIASLLQSMATNEFGVTLDISYNQSPSDDTGLNFALRTNDLTQKSLSIRDKAKNLIQKATYVRPCVVEIQHIVFAEA